MMQLLFENLAFVYIGIGFIIVIVIVLMLMKFKKSDNGKKEKYSPEADRVIEINLKKIVSEIFQLAASQQQKEKSKYIGYLIECRTYLSEVEKSKDTLQVVLSYRDDWKLKIKCEVKISDYADLYWMKKGSGVRIIGELSNIQKSYIEVKNAKLEYKD